MIRRTVAILLASLVAFPPFALAGDVTVMSQVGPRVVQDGSENIVRADRTGASVTQDAHARFHEAVSRGTAFRAVDTTVRLLDAPDGTPVGMTLANPAGSGYNAVLWWASAAHNGTALTAAGVIELTVNENPAAAAVTTGTAVTIKNLLFGSSANSTCIASVAATLPATPTAFWSLGTGLTGAITTTAWAPVLGGWIDGGFILAPNTAVSFNSTVTLTGSGAGMINCTLMWEEVKL